MGGPGSEPTVSQGSATCEWAHGDRFLEQEFTGMMANQPMDGVVYTGFDRYRNQYFMVTMSNMSTTPYFASGNFDPDGKVLSLYGYMDEPMTGEIGKPVKYVTRIIDKDKYIFEIHDMVFGENNTKVVEVTYTRR